MKKTLLGLFVAALFSGHVATADPAASAASVPPLLLHLAPASPASAAAALPQAPQIAATAFVVKDLQSGQVLAGKDLNAPVEPASLTKLMTAYLTLKALDNGTLKPDQMLTVSKRLESRGLAHVFGAAQAGQRKRFD